MDKIPTGLGGELSVTTTALIAGLVSSLVMLGLFVVVGHDLRRALVEVTPVGVVTAIALYIGLRVRYQ